VIAVADPEDFDAAAYVAVLAQQAGKSASAVKVKSVSFDVIVGYTFTAEVTEGQAIAAVATAHNVEETQVRVTIIPGRRLADIFLRRRLQASIVEAIISHQDPAASRATHAAASDAGSTDRIATALSAAGVPDVTASVTTAPAHHVSVVTEVALKATETLDKETLDVGVIAQSAGGTGGRIHSFTIAEPVTTAGPAGPAAGTTDDKDNTAAIAGASLAGIGALVLAIVAWRCAGRCGRTSNEGQGEGENVVEFDEHGNARIEHVPL